jgi:hypothetical protein
MKWGKLLPSLGNISLLHGVGLFMQSVTMWLVNEGAVMGFYFLRAVRDSELEVNNKNKNDISEFKVLLQQRSVIRHSQSHWLYNNIDSVTGCVLWLIFVVINIDIAQRDGFHQEFKLAYQPVTSLVKDEEAELLADHTAFCLGGRITPLCMGNDVKHTHWATSTQAVCLWGWVAAAKL